jgi:hypothetical protein
MLGVNLMSVVWSVEVSGKSLLATNAGIFSKLKAVGLNMEHGEELVHARRSG